MWLLLLAGCSIDWVGVGYHRLPPYLPWIMDEQWANCTRRGSADEVWRWFWPSGAASAIDTFERDVAGTWDLELRCGKQPVRTTTIGVGPPQRSDFGLLNGGCAEVLWGIVPGEPYDWRVYVPRGGTLVVDHHRSAHPYPRGIPMHPDSSLAWVNGRWWAEACEITAKRRP